WSAPYEFVEGEKRGIVTITCPTGMEEDFDEAGILEVIAHNQYGNTLVRKVPVRAEVGLVNYASVAFTDQADGIEISGATFTFAESLESDNVKDVTAIK